jgi:hypothetical protein
MLDVREKPFLHGRQNKFESMETLKNEDTRDKS